MRVAAPHGFAVSRLWETRERQNRSLTRQGYSDIGGVGGALAPHAEATLTAIGEHRPLLGAGAQVEHLRFHPDGRRFALIDGDGVVEIRTIDAPAATSVHRWRFDGRNYRTFLDFDPGGTSLAATFGARSMAVWDFEAPAAAEPLVLKNGGRSAFRPYFSADGSIIGSSGSSRILLWPRRGWRHPQVCRGHDNGVLDVAISLDGHWTASGNVDGTVRLGPIPDLDETPVELLPHDRLIAHLKSLTNLRATPDPSQPNGNVVAPEDPFSGWHLASRWIESNSKE